MTSEFLDTNVILRYFLQDHPDQSAQSTALFQKIEADQIQVVTSHAVIAELVYMLSSRALYGLPRAAIHTRLLPVLSLKSLIIPSRSVVLRALDIYVLITIDFVDALTIAQMEEEQLATVISYDRDFDKFKGVTRREPE